MSTILFDKIIYGPIHSRRLGVSLGVNLFPADGKLCTFNCVYCECGFNEDHRTHTPLPRREEVKEQLVKKLDEMRASGLLPDVITFAGNGEPTLHPDFANIIDDTIAVRNQHCPSAKIAVLSNSTMLDREPVFEALCKVEDNIMKLDSVLDSRIRQIDNPNKPGFCFDTLLRNLCRFKGNLIIQTMFLRGERDGIKLDNTTEEEITGWIDALKQIKPRQVMIYTVDRETPLKSLYKVSKPDLDAIAERARNEGFDVTVSY